MGISFAWLVIVAHLSTGTVVTEIPFTAHDGLGAWTWCNAAEVHTEPGLQVEHWCSLLPSQRT